MRAACVQGAQHPLAMMIGVKKLVNKELGGDSTGGFRGGESGDQGRGTAVQQNTLKTSSWFTMLSGRTSMSWPLPPASTETSWYSAAGGS